jgi:hypothetical protein
MTSRSGCILLVLLCGLLAVATSASAECAWVLWEYNPTKQNPGGSQVPVAAFAEGDGTCKLQMVEQMRAKRTSMADGRVAPDAGRYWLCFPDTVDPRGPKGK